jgi:hypothetical protein
LTFAEIRAAARRIAALPTPDARREALAAIPPDFQDIVRNTATSLRAVPLWWRRKVADGSIHADDIPPPVAAAIREFFPGSL